MAISSRQIGWSTEDNLLWQISKQLEQLTNVTANASATTTSTTTTLPVYNVFTALLTQSGGDNYNESDNFPLEIGVTYTIMEFGSYTLGDFTNVGAPNNEIGTSFIATNTTPNSWGTNIGLSWNAGAPVATVLENTIGNVWFSYSGVGNYSINSNGLFIESKTTTFISSGAEGVQNGILTGTNYNGPNEIYINTVALPSITPIDGELDRTPFEIRVYN